MSGIIYDTYAVVDKTKKIKNRTERSSQQEVNDVYAVVDKKKKTEQKTDDVYNNITSSGVYSTVDDNVTNDEAPNPLYSGLDRNEASESLNLQSKEHLKPVDFYFSKDRKKQSELSPLYVCVGFIVVVSCLVAAVIALVVAFVLIANLQSGITALSMKISNSSESNSPTHSTMSVTKLHTRVEQFLSLSEERFDELLEDTNSKISLLQWKTNNLTAFKNTLPQILNEVNSNISDIQNNLNDSLSGNNLNIVKLVVNCTETTSNYIRKGVAAAQSEVLEFASSLVHDIQRLHVFDSCTFIRTLSLPFLSGSYFVRSSNGSSIEMYCNNSMPLTCDGVTGGWRRIAYVNTVGTMNPECPSGLEPRTNPSSCRRNVSNEGCSSVVFPVGGMYRCVYGRIIARQSGDPDGFMDSLGRKRPNVRIDNNYVDGVSLTYGRTDSRQHIWTFAASIPSIHGEFNCNRCRSHAPPFIRSHYTCDTFSRCGTTGIDICTDSLWTGGPCPPSNSTFYRQLSQPTSDDIEMRVCRDQNRDDEDFLITIVEIYVQ